MAQDQKVPRQEAAIMDTETGTKAIKRKESLVGRTVLPARLASFIKR